MRRSRAHAFFEKHLADDLKRPVPVATTADDVKAKYEALLKEQGVEGSVEVTLTAGSFDVQIRRPPAKLFSFDIQLDKE